MPSYIPFMLCRWSFNMFQPSPTNHLQMISVRQLLLSPAPGEAAWRRCWGPEPVGNACQFLNGFWMILKHEHGEATFCSTQNIPNQPSPSPNQRAAVLQKSAPCTGETDVSLASYSTSVVAAAERMPWPAAEGRWGWGKNHRIHPSKMFLFFWTNCRSERYARWNTESRERLRKLRDLLTLYAEVP